MTMQNTNPLSAYFRQAGSYTKLPSGGRYQPEGNIGFLANGTIPITAMRAKDEFLLKNPDALVSGQAVIELIKSCAPSVVNPELLPNCDLNVIILAIRASSFGDTFSIDVECPKCEHSLSYDVEIDHMLATWKDLPEDMSYRFNDEVVLNLRPSIVKEDNALSIEVFGLNMQMKNIAENALLSEADKKEQISKIVSKMQDIALDYTANMVDSVITPNGVITEREHIDEFMKNIDRKQSSAINDKLKEINSAGIENEIELECDRCGHHFKSDIELDPSSFFA